VADAAEANSATRRLGNPRRQDGTTKAWIRFMKLA